MLLPFTKVKQGRYLMRTLPDNVATAYATLFSRLCLNVATAYATDVVHRLCLDDATAKPADVSVAGLGSTQGVRCRC